MTFTDAFRSKFLENLQQLSLNEMLLTLAISAVIGVLIFLVYKKCYRGVMYSSSFGISLVALTMITALVILAVSSNVILSLGMVGALSIVRFRAAIKDPMDLVYLFWAIASGIVLAAGLALFAILASVIVAVVLLVFSNVTVQDNPYMLILSLADADAEEEAVALLKKNVRRLRVKSKTVTPGLTELNYEVRLRKDDTSFVDELGALPGVRNVALVSYGGEYLNM